MNLFNTEPILKNIKCHFKLENFNLNKHSPQTHLKWCGNFIVLKNLYSYVIFLKNGFVNVTGIINYEDINKTLHNLCAILHIKKPDCEIFIDNTTYSGSTSRKINLISFSDYLHEKGIKYQFNPQFFPGLFTAFQNKGRIVFFSSGKYNILGSKCPSELQTHFTKMTACMKIFSTINMREPLSA